MSNENQNESIDKSWNMTYDRHFLLFLQKHKINICVCSYKSGQIFVLGHSFNQETKTDVLSFWITPSLRPMSIRYYPTTKSLILGTKNRIVQYHNDGVSEPDYPHLDDFDATFTERRVNFVNDIDVHDIVVDKNNEVYFISALFCLKLWKLSVNPGLILITYIPQMLTEIPLRKKIQHPNL